jgi:uncharacterized protein
MTAAVAPLPTRTITSVRTSDRLELLDILRGFALLGILLVNFSGDQGPFFPAADAIVLGVLDRLVDSSFYPLFSFLFGLGLALQLERAQERGVSGVHLYFRRISGLFLIGTIHAILLLGSQDILHRYALVAIVLIPFCRLPPRGVLAAALVFVSLNVSQDRFRAAVGAPNTPAAPAFEQALRAEDGSLLANRRVRADRERNLMGWLESNWHEYGVSIARYTDWTWIPTGDLLFIFLLGLYAGKRRLLHDAQSYRREWSVVAWIALTAAIGGYVYDAFLSVDSPELNVLVGHVAGDFGVSAFYLATIALTVGSGGWGQRTLRVFREPGRVALTNYLLQSAVMVGLFNVNGVGLPDPGATVRLAGNLSFYFLIQVPLGGWWLRRFTFGPAEWLWRSVTYGAIQPFRVSARSSAARQQPAVPA